MVILEAANIKKYFSDRLILDINELKIYSGDHIGIVGLNGAGKTTLLNVLSGELMPDEGFVKRYADISYIHQFSSADDDAGMDSGKEMKEFDVSEKLSNNYSKGSTDGILSGGEKTRLKVANALSRNSVILFADEPTSNLDYKGIELIRQKFLNIETFLLISHDRNLLDALCNKIIEIKDAKIKVYDGNYSFYKEQNKREIEREKFEYDQYISEKSRLIDAIEERKQKSGSIKKIPRHMGNSEARLHRREATEKQEKINKAVNGLKTRLEKLKVKEKPAAAPKIKLDFTLTDPPQNRIILSGKDIDFSYGDKVIFKSAGFEIPRNTKTAIIGDNGVGKTTLLNLIDNRYKNIKIVPKAKIGYFYQGFENLAFDKTIIENVMLDSIQSETVTRTILARLLIKGDDVYKKVDVLSGGERIKLSFAKIFVSDANVIMLDEPTNYLDILSIEALQDILREYEGTLIFVSHDKTFVNAIADRLLIVRDGQIDTFEGNLSAYENSRGHHKKDAADKSGQSQDNEVRKTVLKMRLAEIISKMSHPKADKDKLEEEYAIVLDELKNL